MFVVLNFTIDECVRVADWRQDTWRRRWRRLRGGVPGVCLALRGRAERLREEVEMLRSGGFAVGRGGLSWVGAGDC